LKHGYRVADGCRVSVFKSDRCGIETYKSRTHNFYMPYQFKSDRCGIETNNPWSLYVCALSVQIRPLRDWNIFLRLISIKIGLSSNQTVAGLKRCICIAQPVDNVTFKSDRCGIETWMSSAAIVVRLSSNQTVAGLKQSRPVTMYHAMRVQIRPLRDWNSHEEGCYGGVLSRSNQTVAGLKLFLSSLYDFVHAIVQIRPLRDWNVGKSKQDSENYEVQIRPLRDWNILNIDIRRTQWNVQIRPLRDWNISGLNTLRCGSNVQIRPLRDWNILTAFVVEIAECVQIRPLRDWNVRCRCRDNVRRRCSNQTVAGLKLFQFLPSDLHSVVFKSDRCGIETILHRHRDNCTVAFKSDRCGIETVQWRAHPYNVHLFKSDRCGIETFYIPLD